MGEKRLKKIEQSMVEHRLHALENTATLQRVVRALERTGLHSAIVKEVQIAEDDSASSQEFEVQATEGLCSFKSSETVKTARGSNLENHELERQIPSVSDLSLNAKVTTERMDDCM